MIRPSSRDGMARTCRDDLPDGESGIFLVRPLDTKLARPPVGQINGPSRPCNHSSVAASSRMWAILPT